MMLMMIGSGLWCYVSVFGGLISKRRELNSQWRIMSQNLHFIHTSARTWKLETSCYTEIGTKLIKQIPYAVISWMSRLTAGDLRREFWSYSILSTTSAQWIRSALKSRLRSEKPQGSRLKSGRPKRAQLLNLLCYCQLINVSKIKISFSVFLSYCRRPHS